MNDLDRYIDEVMKQLIAAQEAKDRLAADLRAHYAEAEAGGAEPGRILEGMGAPDDVAAAFNAEQEFRYAGFWQRVVAFSGDFGVLLLISLPFVVVIPRLAPVFEDGVVGMVAMIVALNVLLASYFPLLEARFGKTFGKHLIRIRVIRENGAPTGIGRAFLRRLSLYLDILFIDALFIPFTEKKQRGFDIVAKTVVVREPGTEAPWWGYAVCLHLLPVAPISLFYVLN